MAKQKGITLQRFSGAEFAAALATALQDPNGMAYYVYVDDETGQLVFPAPPSPTMPIGQVDSAGRVRQGNATGSMPVVEDNSSTISTNTAYNTMVNYLLQSGRFGTPSGTSAVVAQRVYRRFQTTVTATAGGEIVAADVGAPSLAGYQSCVLITHIHSDQTDAAIALAWTPSAGALTSGLATTTIATVADTIAPDWSPGLAWQCGTDAATLQVSCGAGVAQANQNITFCGVYWYET